MSNEPSGSLARVIVEPGRRSGRAVIRGTRIAVSDLLSMMAAGMSIDQLLADFPELEREDIAAALTMPRR